VDDYHIWCNLHPGVSDLAFCDHVAQYLGYLRERGLIEGYRLTRRKLGLGPPGLGEFHIVIETRSLAQLEQTFQHVATREGEVERLHWAVYASVRDTTLALYRDFPDPVRAPRS
jgi:hypothetical protein